MTTPSPAEAIAKVLAQHDGGVIIPSREDAHKEEPATAYGWRCECGKADSYDPPRTWAEAKADLRQHEVDAILSAAERAIRAQVAAEYAPAMQTSRHQWWIHECGHVEPVVGPVFASDGCDACETVTGGWRPLFARIAEGTEEGT